MKLNLEVFVFFVAPVVSIGYVIVYGLITLLEKLS